MVKVRSDKCHTRSVFPKVWVATQKWVKGESSRISIFLFLWLNAATVYSELSDIALSMLLPFSTAYLCEARFSALTAMKVKHRRDCAETTTRGCLTSVCLPDSLDLDRCLSILFWLSACE